MIDVPARLAAARDDETWRALGGVLHVDGSGVLHGGDEVEDPAGPADLEERMRTEGWAPYGRTLGDPAVATVLRAMEAVRLAGWLPVFAFVFDEVWLAGRTRALLGRVRRLLGEDCRLIPDFWAYHIPVSADSHGYRPHREASGPLLRPDGSPVSLTTWIPLTDATLDNGCMYVVPQHLEPDRWPATELRRLYGDPPDGRALLHRARALPTPTGHTLSWNHRVRHWGSFSSPRATHPRMSVAFEFIRADVPPGIHEHCRFIEELRPRPAMTLGLDDALPTLKQRLYLVARQILRYWEPREDDGWKALAMELVRGGYPRAWGSGGWTRGLTTSGWLR